MARDTHGLGADTWNERVDIAKEIKRAIKDQISGEMRVDRGKPPFHDELEPHEALAKLERMRAEGDPAAFTPDAYEDERRLRERLR